MEYAKTRKQFGKPIGAFQAVQHQCADMLVLDRKLALGGVLRGLRAAGRRARSAGRRVDRQAYASDAYREVGNRGIQVHGGMGFTWENDRALVLSPRQGL